MIYKRPRKSARGTMLEEMYIEACNRVIGGETCRSVAKNLSMCPMTLFRYVKKYKEMGRFSTGYKPHNRVFTEENEHEFVSYCTSACKLYFGLTTRDLRKLAFEFAKDHKLNYPKKWEPSGMASIDWYKAFMKRHPNLSVRRPEATSLARAMNFNKPNVEKNYSNLAEIMDRLKFQPQNIYNIDETGVTTTQKPRKVLAEKAMKQVGSITSQERGTLVTICLSPEVCTMIYKRPRKSARGTMLEEMYIEACNRVIGGETCRSVAKNLSMCPMTLFRYVKKYKEMGRFSTGYKPHNRVFTEENEHEFVSYCTSACKLYFGLTTRDLRKLAFEFAKDHKLNYPKKWEPSGMASIDWYKAFMKRHPNLSVRRPEATSLARAMNFNKPNVEKNYSNLAEIMDRLKFQPQNIYNIDETGVTTTQKPRKVLAEKAMKQVGSITSQERGTLVTICLAVNAIGNSVPPFFVFPRKGFQPHFIQNGPPGSSGSGNKSGWMQEEDYLLFMQHFIKFAKPSEENRVLVVMDNHSSHINLPVIEFCRENFISILSFPPHTSHKLQPFDRSVFGPFKSRFNAAADLWMRNHPGQRMTIYDLPELVKTALLSAATAANIIAGFVYTGIWPFNDQVFQEDDFAPASVTDMPYETSSEPQAGCSKDIVEYERLMEPSQESAISLNKTPPKNIERRSLGEIRTLPKAQFKVKSKTGRSKGKTAIYTDTPEKQALEEEKRKKEAKKIPKIANLELQKKKDSTEEKP